MSSERGTTYTLIQYAHNFVVFCFVVVISSVLNGSIYPCISSSVTGTKQIAYLDQCHEGCG